MRTLGAGAAVALSLALAGGCAEGEPAPVRRIVVVSLDGLRADYLGAHGQERSTSPFIDRLAAGATVFDFAFSPYPGGLTSLTSSLTGFFPAEHGVYPPRKRLSPDLELVSERFAHFGFRTAAFGDGPFFSRAFAFDRGFDEFGDLWRPPGADPWAVFERGLAFARRLEADDSFLLFLQSAALAHAAPGAADVAAFWARQTPAGAATAIAEAAAGRRPLDAEATAYARALYAAGVRALDRRLERFWAGLEELGLAAETLFVVTSDHGWELMEHGLVGLGQVYPPTSRVPLIVRHPTALPGRSAAPVQTLDLPASLLDLAGLPPPPAGSGRSWAGRLRGEELDRRPAFSEIVGGRSQRALVVARESSRYQLVHTVWRPERDGTWIPYRAGFDASGAELEISVVSFARPREMRLAVDGRPPLALEVGTSWSPLVLSLGGPGRHRIELATDDCRSPSELGMSSDNRCLSFKIRGVGLVRTELFDLTADPLALTDLSASRPEVARELVEELAAVGWKTLAPPVVFEPRGRARQALQALGYGR